LAVALAAAAGLARGGRCRTAAPVARQVVVESGDTLWGLAARFGRPGEDPRVMVEEIRTMNGMGAGAVLRPGMRLRVPDYRCEPARLAQNSP
jgi:predicted Zn-dependent protease